MLEKALQILELLEKLLKFVEERGIRDQTLWLVLGLLVVGIMGVRLLRGLLRTLEEEKAETRRVSDIRDKRVGDEFRKKGSERSSSRGLEVKLTISRLVLRVVFRVFTGKNGNNNNEE